MPTPAQALDLADLSAAGDLMDATNPGLLRTIMEKKVLDDALKAEMSKVIKQSKEAFVEDRQAAAK